MNKARYDVPVKKTEAGVDVIVPLEVANELGFMRLNKGPVEFGSGKDRVVLQIGDEKHADNRRR